MSDQKSELQNYFNDLAAKWPSSFVAREKIGEFSGGLLSPGRMANLDCCGQGPLERVRLGRKVAYPVKPLIDWMIERSQVLE